MSLTRRTFAASAAAAIAAGAQTSVPQPEPGFTSVFDGRTLTGWDFDERLWMVQDGAMVGTTQNNQLAYDEFAILRGRYGDFVFRTEMKLRNHRSGIQFRSEELREWRVQGLQAAAAQDSMWGCIYDQGGADEGRNHGIVANGWNAARKVVHLTGWNTYEVACSGSSVRLALNGTHVLTYDSVKARDGVIAFALIAGPGMQVSFRNIRIKASAG